MKREILVMHYMILLVCMSSTNAISHDYGDALSKSILFFEGQRSGKLPSTQRLSWRKDSALRDGLDKGVSVFSLCLYFVYKIIIKQRFHSVK